MDRIHIGNSNICRRSNKASREIYRVDVALGPLSFDAGTWYPQVLSFNDSEGMDDRWIGFVSGLLWVLFCRKGRCTATRHHQSVGMAQFVAISCMWLDSRESLVRTESHNERTNQRRTNHGNERRKKSQVFWRSSNPSRVFHSWSRLVVRFPRRARAPSRGHTERRKTKSTLLSIYVSKAVCEKRYHVRHTDDPPGDTTTLLTKWDGTGTTTTMVSTDKSRVRKLPRYKSSQR